jgi:hypothetical protein
MILTNKTYYIFAFLRGRPEAASGELRRQALVVARIENLRRGERW